MKSWVQVLLLVLLLISVQFCAPSSDLPQTPTAPMQPTASQEPPPTDIPLPTITALPLPTQSPESEGLDHINIYLVAMGDNGASGKYIGCGDSLVPVEIQIPPTMGVLRAAINELLKLQGQAEYSGSGLMNSLYLSDLELEQAAVIDGEAVIEFSGTLIYGGECDIPRIEEQLKALALQFSTVGAVTITVNGVPLETLLDLRG
jgi:hypothetical protein